MQDKAEVKEIRAAETIAAATITANKETLSITYKRAATEAATPHPTPHSLLIAEITTPKPLSPLSLTPKPIKPLSINAQSLTTIKPIKLSSLTLKYPNAVLIEE